ncbi:hypothetical protein SNE510_70910 [Streptomyces sp. NE5-10]|nr:hypothetical protein SNE510_70910 [Streptomyces sp. NE5-10]
MLAMVPALAFYAVAERRLTGGLTAGATKGRPVPRDLHPRGNSVKRLTAVILLALTTRVAAAGPVPPATGPAIDFRAELQPVDGFGSSMAFQRADPPHDARGLSPAQRREVLDLLLSKEKGAGLSILRLGVGSSTDRVPPARPPLTRGRPVHGVMGVGPEVLGRPP